MRCISVGCTRLFAASIGLGSYASSLDRRGGSHSCVLFNSKQPSEDTPANARVNVQKGRWNAVVYQSAKLLPSQAVDVDAVEIAAIITVLAICDDCLAKRTGLRLAA